MMPTQLLLLAKIGFLVALLVGAFASGHRSGARGVQADWDSEKAQMIVARNQLILENQIHNAQVQAKHDEINIKVSEDHEKALNDQSKKYAVEIAAVRAAGGLRIPKSVCNSNATGTETNSDGGHNDDVAGTVQLPAEIERNLFSEAERADKIVEQARACQSWIRQNGFYETRPQ